MNFRASADLTALQQVFGEIHRRAADWRKPLEESGAPIREEYAREWGSHGPGWPANAKGSTALYQSGDLKRSFTEQGAKGNLTRVTTREGRFGSTLSYAALIQSGGTTTIKGRQITIKPHNIAKPPSPQLLAALAGIATKHFANLRGGTQ